LPLALGGLGVAIFHVSLEARDILECPAGVLGLGSAPQQSLAIYVVLTLLLLADVFSRRMATPAEWAALVGGLLLGGVLVYTSIIANPPTPGVPPGGYKEPVPDICRKPERAT
jgi:hypothetical protein